MEGEFYNPVRNYTSELNRANETIAELQGRLSSLEADEVNDDATDTALLTLLSNLAQRVADLEEGGS